MHARIPQDLDLYPPIDQIQMKVKDADYNVRMR